MFDTNYLDRQREWSERTFGEGKRTLGITKHIEKELDEIRANPTDLMEWVDVIILGMDGFWRAGGSQEQLGEMLELKQKINRGRTYPYPTSEDVPVEHER